MSGEDCGCHPAYHELGVHGPGYLPAAATEPQAPADPCVHHHPSCPKRTQPWLEVACFCPPPVGETVTVEGMPGRWRVMHADFGLVAVGRAGQVEILYDADVALVKAAS